MGEFKLTKNELRTQQQRLVQLEKYLPTLQLKKAMLQTQVNEARVEILQLEHHFHDVRLTLSHSGGLLSERIGLDLALAAKIARVKKRYENIAGVDIPLFEGVVFEAFDYPLFSTPAWVDTLVDEMQRLVIARVKVRVAEEKKSALEKELREVSIRVNLFEKKLIPRANHHIKRIKVFLGDQELSAIGQAKMAKAKSEQSSAFK